MPDPCFLTRRADGEIRAYDDSGARLPMPAGVSAAWAAESGACVIDLRPEAPMVENVRCMNAVDVGRRRAGLWSEPWWSAPVVTVAGA